MRWFDGMADEALKADLEAAQAEAVAEFKRDAERLKKAIPLIRKRGYDGFAAAFKELENKPFALPSREPFDSVGVKELEESIELLCSGEVAPRTCPKVGSLPFKSKATWPGIFSRKSWRPRTT